MTPHHVPRALLPVLGALLAGCSRDEPPIAPLGPSLSAAIASVTLSGSVLGPDGTNICNTVGSGTLLLRLLNPNFPQSGPLFLGVQNVTCRDNGYSFLVDADTAHLRVQLPITDGIGALPWRTLDAVRTGDGDVAHDVHILPGSTLGGTVTLDGAPIEGTGLNVLYALNPTYGATFGSSGPDGHWVEFFGRPLTLQNNVRYLVAGGGCAALGVKVLEAPPGEPFLFPSERSAINCTLTTAPATQFSHTFTRMVVSPLPGDIGGQSSELFDQYGSGWGVQFPVAAGASPSHDLGATHIFLGGLIIGIAPDRVLTGTSVLGEMACGAACRDFGLDATLGFTDPTPAGRKVLWQYSDAPSPEGVGLRIRQRSFDGVRPNDYVLFRFSIQNQGSSTVTFHAGVWGDWDVEADFQDDLGFTEMGGKLMYQVSEAETGIHAGTLMRGDAPISGNFFFSSAEPLPSLTDQVQALNGGLRRETLGPGDLRYIQAIGPITLARGKKAELWVAVVGGENHDQLLANARAADADIGKRQRAGGDAADGSQTVNTQPLGVPGRPVEKSQPPQ